MRDKLFSSILSGIPIENLGNVSWALKTSILRDRVTGILKISQEQYTQEFLAKSLLSQDKKQFPTIKSPPSNPNFPENFLLDSSLDCVDESLKKQFQSDIGAFWWLAQISRPDIFYAVHRCAKLVNKPTPPWSKNSKNQELFGSHTLCWHCFSKTHRLTYSFRLCRCSFRSRGSSSLSYRLFFPFSWQFSFVVLREYNSCHDFINRSRVPWFGAIWQRKPMAPSISQRAKPIFCGQANYCL